MTVGSLFAGIGGFDLGFTRAGFTVSWQVEIDEWCRGILARHFPHAQRYGDIRETGAHNLAPVDVICGGFPCQPFSSAGKRGGTEDDRYLWPEMLRVIREVQPAWVVAENVNGLTVGEMAPVFEQVLSDLENAGYDVQPFVIPACAVDAPHIRKRVWIVAHARSGKSGPGYQFDVQRGRQSETEQTRVGSSDVAHSTSERLGETRQHCAGPKEWTTGSGEAIPDAHGQRREERDVSPIPGNEELIAWDDRGRYVPCPTGEPMGGGRQSRSSAGITPGWPAESGVGRMAHGIPRRVDRLRGLGNAVVPQIPELVAQMILETEQRKAA